MRWLDRALGGALCFGLACLARRPQPARAGETTPHPTLFIGLAEMGSVILADHAMRRARDTHGAALHFLIFEHNRDCLTLTGTVPPENIFGLRADSLRTLALDTLRFMRWARRRGIATAIDTDPCSNYSALLAFLSGASWRAGFQHASDRAWSRAALFSHPSAYRPELHLTQNLLTLTDAALARTPVPPLPEIPPLLPTLPRRNIDPVARQRVQARLQILAPDLEPGRDRILLVNPNVGDLLPQRRWPQENYARLIQGILAAHPRIFVFLLGSGADRASVATLEAAVANRRCRSIAGAFSLAELPALFACSALLLSSDSGPAHFAAVTSLPTIVLFGPETPLRYRPLGNATVVAANIECSPCISPDNRRQTDCRDNRCMRAISVATVMAEIERLLDERRPRPPLHFRGLCPQVAQPGHRDNQDNQGDERAVLKMGSARNHL